MSGAVTVWTAVFAVTVTVTVALVSLGLVSIRRAGIKEIFSVLRLLHDLAQWG